MNQSSFQFAIVSIDLAWVKLKSNRFMIIIKELGGSNQELATPELSLEDLLLQQKFPIQFKLTSNNIGLILMECSQQKAQLGQQTIQMIAQGGRSIKQVSIITTESKGKQPNEQQVCKLKYTFENKPEDSKDPNKQQQAQKQIQQNNNTKQNQNQSLQNRSMQRNKNYQALSEKISKIKEEMDVMLKEIEDYDQEEGNEEDYETVSLGYQIEEIPKTIEWYQDKYDKEIVDQTSVEVPKLPSKSKELDIKLEYSEYSIPHIQVLNVDSITVHGAFKPHQIIFFQLQKNQEENSILSLTLPSEQSIHTWNKKIKLPDVKRVMIRVVDLQSEENSKTYEGCLQMRDNEKQIRCGLFDRQGALVGIAKIEYSMMKAQQIQTIDVLNSQQEDSRLEEEQFSSIYYASNPQESFMKLDKLRVPGQIKSLRREQSHSQIIFQEAEPSLTKRTPTNFLYPERKSRRQHIQIPRTTKKSLRRKLFIASNSVSINYIPNQMEAHRSPNEKISSKSNSRIVLKTEQHGEEPLPSNRLNIDILHISIKLKEKHDPFFGKFAKVHTKEREPYMTESITLSKNLSWKCKGCSFKEVPMFNELIINIYSENTQYPRLEGTARFCLALLAIDQQQKVKFHRDAIRNSEQKQIGEILVGYKFVKSEKSMKKEGRRKIGSKQQTHSRQKSNLKMYKGDIKDNEKAENRNSRKKNHSHSFLKGGRIRSNLQ